MLPGCAPEVGTARGAPPAAATPRRGVPAALPGEEPPVAGAAGWWPLVAGTRTRGTLGPRDPVAGGEAGNAGAGPACRAASEAGEAAAEPGDDTFPVAGGVGTARPADRTRLPERKAAGRSRPGLPAGTRTFPGAVSFVGVWAGTAAPGEMTSDGTTTSRPRRASKPRSLSATAPVLRWVAGRLLCHTRAITMIWSFSLSGAKRHHTRGSVR